MITQHPQQESTFLQDLQTGLDEFQPRDTPKADLLLDGTRLFRGDALTAPGTAIWLGWLGHADFGLYAPDDISSSEIKAWVQQSRIAPWLHDLEERCVAQGIWVICSWAEKS